MYSTFLLKKRVPYIFVALFSLKLQSIISLATHCTAPAIGQEFFVKLQPIICEEDNAVKNAKAPALLYSIWSYFSVPVAAFNVVAAFPMKLQYSTYPFPE